MTRIIITVAELRSICISVQQAVERMDSNNMLRKGARDQVDWTFSQMWKRIEYLPENIERDV